MSRKIVSEVTTNDKSYNLDGIIHKSDFVDKFIEGVNEIASPVVSTLGPSGNNVLIDAGKAPYITKDGVDVANNIPRSQDKIKDIIMTLIKEACIEVSKVGGDGTTTTTALVEYIIKNVLRAEVVNSAEMRAGMEAGLTHILENIEQFRFADGITIDHIRNVAKISANNDETISKVITEAIKQAGSDGVVEFNVVGDKQNEDTLDVSSGHEIIGGVPNETFLTTRGEYPFTKLTNPHVLVYDGTISKLSQIQHIADEIKIDNGTNLMNNIPCRDLIIFATGYSPSIVTDLSASLGSIDLNSTTRTMPAIIPVCILGADYQIENFLDDISLLTNSVLLKQTVHNSLSTASINELGECEGVIASLAITKVFLSEEVLSIPEVKEELHTRVSELKQYINSIEDQYTKRIFQTRLGKLNGKIVIVNVFGHSDITARERKARFVDALHATKSTIDEGLVEGGGVTYVKLNKIMNEIEKDIRENHTPSFMKGFEIVTDSLLAPFNVIMMNANYTQEEIDNFIDDIQAGKINGVDARKKVVVKDMSLVDYGIIDPFKVSKSAVKTAISISSATSSVKYVVIS